MTAYLPILTMICLVVLFIAASFTASQLLGPRRPNAAKQAPYESGIVPEQEPSERFPVKFYLVAMTFIVLDVEIIFLYPFTTIFRSFVPAAYGLAIMGVFLLTLLVPFAYLLSTGALDWGPIHKLVDRAIRDGGVPRQSPPSRPDDRGRPGEPEDGAGAAPGVRPDGRAQVGDLDGRVREHWWDVQQLRARAGRRSDRAGRC